MFEEPPSANSAAATNGFGDSGGDVNVSSADVGFVNMIRTGILSLQLLPGNRCAS